MNAAELINAADFDGIRLALTDDGDLRYSGNHEIVKEWLPTLKENKTAIVTKLHQIRRHAKVLAMLGGKRFALFVDDDSTDPVIATVGIRDLATFELAIPRHSYNGMELLELIEKHYGENYANP